MVLVSGLGVLTPPHSRRSWGGSLGPHFGTQLLLTAVCKSVLFARGHRGALEYTGLGSSGEGVHLFSYGEANVHAG